MSERGASIRTVARTARRSSATATIAIVLGLAVCGAVATIKAINKPLWFDEFFTLTLAKMRSPAELVEALRQSLDAMPPPYYLLCRAGILLVRDDHLGVRLPSLVGFLATISGVYCFLAIRADRVSSLIGAAFVAGTVVADYACEGRPYALLTGSVCCAACAWQRSDRSRAWGVALACFLGLAVSCHYFAVFVWPAFVFAESLVIVCDRRLRTRVWLALAAGAVPFVVCWPLLARFRGAFSQNPWIAVPKLSFAVFAPQVLFKWSGGIWAPVTTAVLAAVCVAWIARSLPVRALRASVRLPPGPLQAPECGLALGLLAVPLVAVVAARIAHAGMTERYMMPAVIGAALAIGALANASPPVFRGIALSAMLIGHGLMARPAFVAWSKGALLDTRMALERDYEAMILGTSDEDVPVVFANGLDYMQMAYYCPPATRARAWTITEPALAVALSPWKSGVIDVSLRGIEPLFPLQLSGYDEFVSRHESFILCANDDQTEWLTSKLLQDGHQVTLLAKRSITRIYNVRISRR